MCLSNEKVSGLFTAEFGDVLNQEMLMEDIGKSVISDLNKLLSQIGKQDRESVEDWVARFQGKTNWCGI